MYRYRLEDKSEELREEHGVEFKFIRSSSDVRAMDFFAGVRSSTAPITDEAPSDPARRHVEPIVVSGPPQGPLKTPFRN